MNIHTEIVDEYAIRKGNALLSYWLNCVRHGNRNQLETELVNPDYVKSTRLILNDLSYTYLVIQFLWPQIVRAAVDGGMFEIAASSLYMQYVENAKRTKSVFMLLELHKQMILDYAEKVAQAKAEFKYTLMVRKCRLYIREQLYEPISVCQIAKVLNFSKSHLSRIYKQETGETISERIRNEKVSEAMRLIQHSTLSLSAIGQKLGFCSQSHFTDTFRKKTGCTPRQFRNNFMSNRYPNE